MGLQEITFINITDNDYPTKKKGGKAEIVQGGVLTKFAVIEFTSKGGKGLNFNVDIYGK